MPFRQYIEHLYLKRLGKERPEVILSIQEKVRRDEEKKAQGREAKTVRQVSLFGPVGGRCGEFLFWVIIGQAMSQRPLARKESVLG